MRRISAFLTAAVTVLTAACQPNYDFPTLAKIQCTATADCPTGNVCNNAGRCVLAAKLDTTPPDLVGNPVATPASGRASALFAFDLSVTKKLIAPPTVLLNVSTPAPIDCTAVGELVFHCSYTATGAENNAQGGPIPFSVRLEDDSGNVTVKAAAGILNLDFTPPSAAASSVSPALAKLGATLEIYLAASEPIVGEVVLHTSQPLDAGGGTLSDRFTLTSEAATPQVYRLNHVVTAADPAGKVDFSVSMTDGAGNVATAVALGSLSIDNVPPWVKDVTTTDADGFKRSRFSEVAGFNTVVVTFGVPKSLDDGAGTVAATLGPWPMTCGTYQANTKTYRCMYSVSADGSERSGANTISISTSDLAGNTGYDSSQIVMFDFTPLTLTAVAGPNPARAGDRVVATVSSNKALLLPPQLTATPPGGLAMPPPETATGNASWTYSFAPVSPPLKGTFDLQVSATDDVGHAATQHAALAVDGIVPVISGVKTTNAAGVAASRFSEVAGFNTVVVTFRVPKSLDSGAGTVTATLANRPMVCGTYQAASGTYSCTYAISPNGSEGSGASTIAISTSDKAGNTGYDSSQIVTFDFTPLSLTEVVRPNPAKAGDHVVATVSSNKALAQAPQMTATAVGAATGALVVPVPIGASGNASWTFNFATAAAPLAGSFDLLATATDDVGHAATQHAALSVDAVIPVVSGVTVDALARYSSKANHNTVTMKFASSKNVDAAGGPVVTIGGFLPGSPPSPLRMTCGTYRATAPNYTCQYTVTGQELASDGVTPISQLSQANLPVVISVTDSAGNTGSGNVGVTFDFAPPAVAYAAVTYAPGSGNLVATPSAATYGTVITLFVSASEAIDPAKTVSATAQAGAGPALQFTLVGAARPDGATFQAVLPSTWPLVPATTLTPTIAWTDLVGNGTTSTTFSVPSITVHTTPGAPAPNVAAGGPISYARTPWGSTATGGLPAHAITGGAGAAKAGAMLIAFDGPGATAAPIGQGTVAADGSFGPITLTRGDRPVVWLAAADEAGNESPVVAVHNVTWTASFNGKTPGLTAANPHVMRTDPSAELTHLAGPAGQPGEILAGLLNPVSGRSTEVASYAGLYSGAATSSATAASAAWVGPLAGPATIPGNAEQAMAYDSARGVTVMFGGDAYPGSTWEWNGSALSLLTPAVSPPGRQYSSMAYDARRGVTVLFGGTGASGNLQDTWVWNGTIWTQMFPAVSPPPMSNTALVYDSGRGVIVLFGGRQGGSAYGDTWEWDGATWTQKNCSGTACNPLAAAPSARNFHALSYDAGRGVTVLFGGRIGSSALNGETWEWNGATWKQVNCTGTPCIAPTGSPRARQWATMAYDTARQATVMFGGNAAHPVDNDTWLWNGTAWTQVSCTGTPCTPSASPPGRIAHAMSYDSARGVMVVFWGVGTQGTDLHDGWEWDGATWTQVVPAPAPPARSGSNTAYDPATGITLLFGGIDANGSVLNDTWAWNGTGWVQVSCTGTPCAPSLASPPARKFSSLSYDAATHVTLLFGGQDALNKPLGDTWAWNGTAWSQLFPSASPSGRWGPAMAPDPLTGGTVLFGGWTGSPAAPLNDTWEWTGTTWSQVSCTGTPCTPSASPGGRYNHAMAHDSARHMTVLFGGEANDALNDTWEWNGTTWTQRASATVPPSRFSNGLAFDTARQVTVLFGGPNGHTNPFNDTWEWNGTTWRQTNCSGSPCVATTTSPAQRFVYAMSYDSARGEMVLFGGLNSGLLPLNDTWTLPSGTQAFPSRIAAFDFAATGETLAGVALQQLTLGVSAGGTGYVNTVAQTGAILAAWDTAVPGHWRALASNALSATAPAPLNYTTSSPWEAAAYTVAGPWQKINFALFPIQSNGAGSSPGQLAVRSPELTAQYLHSESACTVSVASSCQCASDEVACGSGSSALCSATQIDPRNCGGCGVVCTNGKWCVAGSCQCPASEIACGGICTDTTMDPANCGGCGHICALGQSCGGGTGL